MTIFCINEHRVALSTRPECSPNANPHVPLNVTSPLPLMYTFIFMNIARLFTKIKQKIKLLSDFCDGSTLFLCFCETFLHDGILDAEIKIPSFNIVRCDRSSRVGGGICIYIRDPIIFSICLSYSNSVCDLLIIKLHQPSLYIILVYRPPSCSQLKFSDIICKIETFTLSLPAPLPNIIMLGDFNFPGVNWSNPINHCTSADLLIDIASLLFINQQIHVPTRKSNTLDLIFCSDELINSIDVCDTFVSDHRIITAETQIQIPTLTPSVSSLNPPQSSFDELDFKKSDWSNLSSALHKIDWASVFESLPHDQYFNVAIELISVNCSHHVPSKGPKKSFVSKYHRDRRILMRSRAKLNKKANRDPLVSSKIEDIEKQISLSHRDERFNDESRAVARIKVDPNFFFRYAKKFSICNL